MSDGTIPWFRFYPADFMRGVRGMSATEVGLYQMLLCLIYEENGPVEYHVLRLSTYAGMREATFLKTFEKLVALGKLTLVDGMVSNARAEIEISNRAHDLKNNSKAGKVSVQKRQQKQRQDATTVQQTFNHTDTDTDTDKEDGGGGSASEREADPDPSQQDLTFREQILVACGVSTSGLTGRGGQMIGRSGEIAEINARMTERRISEAEVLQIVSEEMAAKNAGRDPGPPSSLRFFLSALDRFAAARDAPIPDLPTHVPRAAAPPGPPRIRARLPSEIPPETIQ